MAASPYSMQNVLKYDIGIWVILAGLGIFLYLHPPTVFRWEIFSSFVWIVLVLDGILLLIKYNPQRFHLKEKTFQKLDRQIQTTKDTKRKITNVNTSVNPLFYKDR